ncbi:MAG: GNAT family N-acetyltransferase [Ramlibacter sp.]|nr:GNAT family N-acetyltransferase [Cryobacterium sp.]
MPLSLEASPLVRQAHGAAARAARAARIRVVDESDLDRLRDVEALLIAVWGTSPHGAPIPTDLLRSISHAGCNVTAAYTEDGTLCGAAAAIVSPGNASMYSLIAGVLPGLADAGVGFALKQHQRSWALARGIETMTWTFDPLVSRNARFNLTKLGAHATEYLENFYGPMDDDINADDQSDRLVAVWPLTSPESVACSEGLPLATVLPDIDPADVRGTGPDGRPNVALSGDALWCRVPTDIVALRTLDPEQAAAWRASVREIFTTEFGRGRSAVGVTRDGWYRLETGGQQ